MPDIFVDSSGWATVFVRTEYGHPEAVAALQSSRSLGEQVVTTNYILAELTALLASPLRVPRSRQFSYLDTIRASTWVHVFHVDVELEAEAYALWRGRTDKRWSLVDCTSFVVMEHRRISEALTTDRHFEKAGFIRLLK